VTAIAANQNITNQYENGWADRVTREVSEPGETVFPVMRDTTNPTAQTPEMIHIPSRGIIASSLLLA
jgi:hypothetical protein